MWWFSKKLSSHSHLGIDIGTSSIRVVKILKYSTPKFVDGKEKIGELQNYGEVLNRGLLESSPGEGFQSHKKLFLESEVTRSIKLLLSYSEETEKEVVMAIPMYSVFVDQLKLPAMSFEEISSAIEFEARAHVPVPIEDVKLAWQIISQGEKQGNSSDVVERTILLIAVPKETIFVYEGIAKQLGLNLKALEIESASIMRALNLTSQGVYVVLDIGGRNTNISLIRNGFLALSHHIEISGEEITRSIARGLGISMTRAEEFKQKEGLVMAKRNPELANLLYPIIDRIIDEVKRTIATLPAEEVKKLILVGGSTSLLGLREYIHESLVIPIDIANPWAKIDYNPALESKLRSYGLKFTAAVGLALY